MITILAIYTVIAIVVAAFLFLIHISGTLDFTSMLIADGIMGLVFVIIFIVAVIVGYKRGK